MTCRLVIAGQGSAVHRLVASVRRRDLAGRWQVTVVGEEPRPAYDRAAPAPYLTDRAEPAFPAHDEHVTVRIGERVTAIDRVARPDLTLSRRSAGVAVGDELLFEPGAVGVRRSGGRVEVAEP